MRQEASRGARSPLAVPLALVGLLLVAGTSFWLGRLSVRDEAGDPPPLAEGAPVAEGVEVAEAAEAHPPPEPPADPAPVEPAAEALKAPAAPRKAEGLQEISVSIQGSLASTLAKTLGKEVGDPLAQVTGRLMVWWVNLTKDLRKGDGIHLIYELPDGSEPVVHALSYSSQRLGRTFRAYRFQAPGSDFARYFDEEGKEIELRLERSPVEGYEQVTSLLRDGRGHAGVDFKAPTGTPIVSPWSGVVVRTNFNARINGNCVEMEDSKGRRVLYLHLSELAPEMKPGAKVRRGQRVGLVGNTGRSTAPHLHYQMMSKAGRVLDPFKLHPTYRRSLEPDHLPAFGQVVRTFDRRLELLASR